MLHFLSLPSDIRPEAVLTSFKHSNRWVSSGTSSCWNEKKENSFFLLYQPLLFNLDLFTIYYESVCTMVD